MSHNSTRLSIPIADTTDAADVPASIAALVAAIDSIMAVISKGTFASRPAAGTIAGKLYYATDTAAFYVTDGTTWQLVNPYPGTDLAAGVASLRTLGTAGTQATAGNDSRLSDTRTPSALSVVTSTIAAGAVTFAKMGFATPIALQKVGYNGTGFSTPGSNAKAGRLLGPTDFSTLLGMTTPALLAAANGTTTDTSGNAVTITNNGSVSVSGASCSGLDGVSATAFLMDGATQYLTAPNTMKQKYGSWGCWIQSAQPNWSGVADQTLISMWQPAGSDQSFRLMIEGTTGLVRAEISTSGASLVGAKSYSHSRVNDGMWHFVMMSWDGAKVCVYVDGALEGSESITFVAANAVGQGPLNQSASLLLGIGAHGNGTQKFEGKMSNVFVTKDVLDETAYRSLYAKKFAHGLGTQPELYVLNIRKYFRSKTYVAADFTGQTSSGTSINQPLMGGNMENTTWVNDFGSLGTTWSASLGDAQAPYPFQGQQGASQHGSFYLNGTGAAGEGSDTSLPSGASPNFSYGIWFRCSNALATVQQLFEWGTASGNAGRGMWIDANGVLWAGDSAQLVTNAVSVPGVCDGQWHFAVCTETTSGATLTQRKLYLDGVLVSGVGGVTFHTITLGGALGARIGRNLGGTLNLIGSVGGFFIINNSILAQENVRELYSKVNTSVILADRQPMDPSNCVERADATNIYWIGDDLEPTDYVELMVA